jgi:uncharacterized protein (TIGR02145 family)
MNSLKQSTIILVALILTYSKANSQQLDVIRDRDGNTYRIKSFPDNTTWMTESLKINIPGSYCYEGKTENCERYGRLHTWTAANEGCRALGDGWRLPRNEDWQQMARLFGGVRGDSKDSGTTAYKALTYGGETKFDALLGGSRDPDSVYRRLEAHGFYWTSTEIDSSTAWFYNFGKNLQMLGRHEGEKQRAASVRCIRRGIR